MRRLGGFALFLVVALVPIPGLAGEGRSIAHVAPGDSAPGDGIRQFPYLRLAGDLDADGLRDTVSAELSPPIAEVPGVGAAGSLEQVVTARSGAGGAILWSRILEGTILPARVGSGATPGLIAAQGPVVERQYCATLCVWASTGAPGGVLFSTQRSPTDRVVVAAVDGAGATVWSRTFDQIPGAHVFAETSSGDHRLARTDDEPAFAGLLRAAEGIADVLVSLADRTEVAGQVQATTRTLVLSGADGRTRFAVETSTSGIQPSPRPAGDLDGDGVDDFVIVHYPGTGGLAAYRGTDGSPLWTNSKLGAPRYPTVTPVGDVNGDGHGELTIAGSDRIGFGSPAPLRLVDGETGAVLLSVEADVLTPVGDVDGDGIGELVTQSASTSPDWTTALVRYRLLTLAGTVLASRDHTATASSNEYYIYADPRPRFGDLDADGVQDLGHIVVRSTYDGPQIHQASAVSGRTLAPAFSGSSGLPLLTALGGQPGDDLLLAKAVGSGQVAVSAQDGASGALLWSQKLAVDPELNMSTLEAAAGASDVTGDGIPDVVVSLRLERLSPEDQFVISSGPYSVPSWVLDGRDGRVIWEV